MKKYILQTVTTILVSLILLISCDQTKKTDQTTDTSSKSKDSLVVLTVATDSISVLELLLANHQVDYKSSSMGAFVKAIDSTESGSGIYWLYSVNDSMIPVAADNYQVGAGDSVRWHFRKSNSE